MLFLQPAEPSARPVVIRILMLDRLPVNYNARPACLDLFFRRENVSQAVQQALLSHLGITSLVPVRILFVFN